MYTELCKLTGRCFLPNLEVKHEIDRAVAKEVVVDMHTEGSAPALSA